MHATSETNRRKRRMIRALARVSFAIICLWGALMVFLDRYGQRDRLLAVKDEPAAQAIIVLGAQVLPGGEIGESLRSRAGHALALYRQGKAGKLICTGGLGTFPPEESVATAHWFQRQGVPAADILVEKTSTSTWENLQNAADLCRAHGWKRVIIVSDPYHLWRAERDARILGLSPIVSPSPNRAGSFRAYMTFRETLAVMRDLVS
jgi:uncharacterized SAM-binding protein YcdF (DUF218 family)